jgi:hypothetical protein
VLERVQVRPQLRGDEAVGLMAAALPPDTNPPDAAWLMAPRLIELCFQTAGVWDIQTNGTMALPLSVDRVTAYGQPETAGGRLYGLVTAVNGGASYNAVVVDENGKVYIEVKGYRTVQLPGRVEFA